MDETNLQKQNAPFFCKAPKKGEAYMDEDNGMNFAEFVAILSGNTDLLNKAKLDNKIMQLEKEYSIFKKERRRAERKIATNTQEIVSRQWSKTAELDTLKKECADLQRRIDENLKAVENGENPEQPKPQMSGR